MKNAAEVQLANANGGPPWVARSVIVAIGLGMWFLTQSLIGSRAPGQAGEAGSRSISAGDVLFSVTRPIHEYLQAHSRSADALLIASSGVIDAIGIWLILASIFGTTIRPFLGLLLLFALRQLTQALCALPAPEGMIWRSPGWPSLLVTYHVANDFFFSGHTGVAVFGATQLARTRRLGLVLLGIAIAVFETATVILLRAHYTMDVFAGAIAALWVAQVADRVAPVVDRALARRTGEP